jgi:large repetitive protein
LLGDGSGGFSGPTNYDVGGSPTSIVLGDFTHDGHLDVAAANYNSDDVGVLYGGGDGTFSTPTHSATGSSPYSIAAGDFNGDGWLDAATANQGDNTVSVLINDHNWPAPPPPPPPTVSINDVAVTEGNTGTTDATFTISLSKASSQDVTVHYATADGTATAGSDYTAASGDVTIPHGQTTYAVTIAVTGDRVAESTETFAVNLSAPVNATIGDGQGTGTIVDDEPLISINDVTVTEGNTGRVSATFTVSLSAVYDADVTIHYDTANGTATAGSDYTAASGTVTIPAGQTSKTLTVAVLGDRVAEPTETFVVNLSAPVNAGVSDGQGVGTILDDEPRISIKNVTKKEGNGGTTQFIFTVTLSAAYDQAVTLNYATANGTATAGSDYQAKSGTLTFAPGVTSMTITILVYGEKTKEADETFFVNLSGASSNAFFLAPQGVGTIQDNDTPPGKKK